MIRTIIRIGLQRLWHNKPELLLLFVVPIAFFSIFALIFGSRDGNGSTPKIRLAICQPNVSELTDAVIEELVAMDAFRLYQFPNKSNKSSNRQAAADDKAPQDTRNAASTGESDAGLQPKSEDASDSTYARIQTLEEATQLVRMGTVSVALVVSNSKASVDDSEVDSVSSYEEELNVQILGDSYNQVASELVTAMAQKAIMTAKAKLAQRQSKRSQQLASTAIANQARDANANLNAPIQQANFETHGLPPSSDLQTNAEAGVAVEPMVGRTALGPPLVTLVDVLGENKSNPSVAMYAAGIAVMFLLFSATSAGGSLLDERENSTLERLLASQLTIDELLLGKWCYMAIIGLTQMVVMFGWAQIVFGVDTLQHLDGFLVMTFATVAAASSFALMLATCCQTRNQLNWVSIVLILAMSALGGSMVPRYLMSETMQQAGLITFNAWALDGYNKIFWRDMGVQDIGTELGILIACAFCFLIAARGFAIRWERG